MQEKIYIHYGHKDFDEKLFMEITNEAFVKPRGGLWASDVNAKYGWKDWCKDENFRDCAENNSFKFKLKDGTRVLKIDNTEMLKTLPVIELPYKFSWITLDFEKLKEEYDVIEVLISEDHQLYWDLYGWDCDSLLVMNKDVIEIIDYGESDE